MSAPRFDAVEIRRALGILVEPGSVVELRVPATRRGTVSGYYNDLDALARDAARLSGTAPGVYVTLNPVRRDLLARAVNRTIDYAKHSTSDADVPARWWLFIDCDAVRPAGISSTDAEHAAALARVNAVVAWLVTVGVSKDSIITADSGNGGWVLLRIDLPNDAEATTLCRNILATLGQQFSDAVVTIDQTTFNAARIAKIGGTMAAKGDSTADRPHRLSRLTHVPEGPIAPVERDILERIAGGGERQEQRGKAKRHRNQRAEQCDLEAYLREHDIVVRKKKALDDGTLFELETCVWNSEHIGACSVTQFASGTIVAKCFHNACAGKGWRDFLAAVGDDDAANDEWFADGHFVPARLGDRLSEECPVRLGHDRKLWRYHDGVYRPDGDDWARQRTRELVAERFRRNHLEEVTAYLRAQLPSLGHTPPTEFINCKNGLLEWRTGTLHPHTPDVLSTNQIAAAWNPAATAPTVARFFNEALPDDASDLAEEMFGYALYAGNPMRKAVMLLGPGGNGKSTFLKLLIALLGAENVATVALQELSEDRFACVDVFGKLANICGDLDARSIERTDQFKKITGGDPIRAQHKFQAAFSFISYALPLFSANEAPRVSDQTDAWFDRWIILPMMRRFEGTPECDLDLDRKLALELDGVFVRAVTGLQRLMARGRFDLPTSVQRARDRYRQTLDTVRAFVTECCHLHPDAWADKAILYREYKAWCDEGRRMSLAASTFNAHLQQACADLIQERKRHGRPGWLGLGHGPDDQAGDAGDDGDDFSTSTNRARARRERESKGRGGSKVVPIVPPVPPACTICDEPTTPLDADGTCPPGRGCRQDEMGGAA